MIHIVEAQNFNRLHKTDLTIHSKNLNGQKGKSQKKDFIIYDWVSLHKNGFMNHNTKWYFVFH